MSVSIVNKNSISSSHVLNRRTVLKGTFGSYVIYGSGLLGLSTILSGCSDLDLNDCFAVGFLPVPSANGKLGKLLYKEKLVIPSSAKLILFIVEDWAYQFQFNNIFPSIAVGPKYEVMPKPENSNGRWFTFPNGKSGEEVSFDIRCEKFGAHKIIVPYEKGQGLRPPLTGGDCGGSGGIVIQ